MVARLEELGRHVSPSEISEIWVFPPLPELDETQEFVLLTRRQSTGLDRVCVVDFTEVDAPAPNGTNRSGTNGHAASGNGSNGNGADRHGGNEGPIVRVTEYGRVPSHRVQRVVDGFRSRLGDARDPLHLRVDGCPDRWGRMLASEPTGG